MKGLLATINKECKFKNNQQHNLKMAKDPNRHLAREEVQMAKKRERTCSLLCVFREMQVKEIASSTHLLE
jgi:hypothetical protein